MHLQLQRNPARRVRLSPGRQRTATSQTRKRPLTKSFHGTATRLNSNQPCNHQRRHERTLPRPSGIKRLQKARPTVGAQRSLGPRSSLEASTARSILRDIVSKLVRPQRSTPRDCGPALVSGHPNSLAVRSRVDSTLAGDSSFSVSITFISPSTVLDLFRSFHDRRTGTPRRIDELVASAGGRFGSPHTF